MRPVVGEWTPPPELSSTEGSNPPCLNLSPVKAVRHARSGWVASEGEGSGKERNIVGSRKEQLAVERGAQQEEPGGDVCRGIYVKLLR